MIRIGRWWLLCSAALVALVMLAGCNGDGDGDSSDPESLLQRMVLTQNDLPDGYVADETTFSSNEDVALGDEERLSELEEQGRILGHSAPFSRGNVPATQAPYFGVVSEASLYETPEGASDSFAASVEEARATDWEAILGFGDMVTEEIERDLAEETVWIRVTGVVALGEDETPVLVIDDQILLREGRGRGYLRFSSAVEGSSDRMALIDEAAALAETQVTRMREALGQA